MNKQAILTLVTSEVNALLRQAELAAENAHKAAIDDQSVAETQYDTLAIEASYLAEGQSRRIDQLNTQLQQLSDLTLTTNKLVAIGAVVELEYDNGECKWVFVLPCGAGIQVQAQNHTILAITPQAPLAKAILKKTIDDEFILTISGKSQSGVVSAIY